MIRKKDLRGKYVEYLDRDGKNRIGRVVNIVGSWLTVKNILGRRRRVHKDRVLCRMRPKLGKEEIEWQ
jgi:hypothetical protein